MKSTFKISEIKEYISGEKFSSGLTLFLNEKKIEMKSRINLICELVKGKRVIHLGFTDHLPLIKAKIENNTWLHGLLDKQCSECFGVDIDQETVDYVRTEYGYDNTICADILVDDLLKEKQGMWDYIILGEILEHVENPVNFIGTIQKKYQGKINKIIITVPNLFCKYHARNILKGVEHINTDHRYWFTPFTILKVVHEAGFRNAVLDFAELCPLNFKELSIRKLKKYIGIQSKYYPTYFLSLIVIADF